MTQAQFCVSLCYIERMPATSRLDYLEQRALVMEPDPFYRAPAPLMVATEESGYMQEIASRFPIDNVVDFAAEKHDIDAGRLTSLLIRLVSKKGIMKPEGSLDPEPHYHRGALHYPVIDISVGPRMPSQASDFMSSDIYFRKIRCHHMRDRRQDR